jgi:thiol-disulfide isomerase/thioredoxin
MIRTLLFLLLISGVAPAAFAAEWPADFPREGECAVCAFRGAVHGDEPYVAWREHGDARYAFCSNACAEAFDQMPSGYAKPVLPRPGPEFHWSTLSGSEIEPTGQAVLLVDFWATWCAPCIKAIPDLEQIAAEFAADGLQVVGVSIDEDRSDLDSFLKRRPVDYSIVHDGGDDPAWWQFRVPAIPAGFLLNAQGEIVAQWSGEIDVEELRVEVEALVDRD